MAYKESQLEGAGWPVGKAEFDRILKGGRIDAQYLLEADEEGVKFILARTKYGLQPNRRLFTNRRNTVRAMPVELLIMGILPARQRGGSPF